VKFTTSGQDMQGRAAAPRIGPVASVDVVDPMDSAAQFIEPAAPLLAVLTDSRPRCALGGDGMMVSPKGGGRRGRQFRAPSTVCSGPRKSSSSASRGRCARALSGIWNTGAIHFDRVVYMTDPRFPRCGSPTCGAGGQST